MINPELITPEEQLDDAYHLRDSIEDMLLEAIAEDDPMVEDLGLALLEIDLRIRDLSILLQEKGYPR